jgi:hypothetical protein
MTDSAKNLSFQTLLQHERIWRFSLLLQFSLSLTQGHYFFSDSAAGAFTAAFFAFAAFFTFFAFAAFFVFAATGASAFSAAGASAFSAAGASAFSAAGASATGALSWAKTLTLAVAMNKAATAANRTIFFMKQGSFCWVKECGMYKQNFFCHCGQKIPV